MGKIYLRNFSYWLARDDPLSSMDDPTYPYLSNPIALTSYSSNNPANSCFFLDCENAQDDLLDAVENGNIEKLKLFWNVQVPI